MARALDHSGAPGGGEVGARRSMQSGVDLAQPCGMSGRLPRCCAENRIGRCGQRTAMTAISSGAATTWATRRAVTDAIARP
jgi:hypothetical protein